MSDGTIRITIDSVAPLAGHEDAVLAMRFKSGVVARQAFEFQGDAAVSHPAEVPLDALVEHIVSERLRRIVDRLKVNADGPLVPEAEVYVRTVVARAIEEELEER